MTALGSARSPCQNSPDQAMHACYILQLHLQWLTCTNGYLESRCCV